MWNSTEWIQTIQDSFKSSCEYGNEPSGSIKVGKYPYQLWVLQTSQGHSTPRKYFEINNSTILR